MSIKKGKEIIRKKVLNLTNNPGIYKMLSEKNEILYVGKAKNIPNRLKSYVSDSHLPIRTERMLALTNNLEKVTTSSEAEALLLEANLIKKFKPKFIIDLATLTGAIIVSLGEEYAGLFSNDDELSKNIFQGFTWR